ncbi:hypothetical protein H5410_047234 [Solanum commersonii]|uniref:Uncharacterized protein n=1 Tax=Solanum commersonii TaxID=4109 RepID=A0A9J5XIK2_SOLCO|nr:hypothetical protein H5410_047234 [Solanum commersonii]
MILPLVSYNFGAEVLAWLEPGSQDIRNLNTSIAKPLIAYSDDDNSSILIALPSAPASPDVQSHGEKNYSTDTSLTSLPKDPSPTRPPSPLMAFTSGDPFTPSLSPHYSELPNPNPFLSSSLPPIETPIPTITNTVQSPSPTLPPYQYLDDIPLSVLHPQKPCRPHKHSAVKQTSLRTPLTRSVSQDQMKEALDSSIKRHRVNKSHVYPPSSPFMLDSESKEILASLLSVSFPQSQKPSKRDLFLDVKLLVFEKKLVDFYTNLTILERNVITSTVNGVELVFDHIKLGEILKIPTNGLADVQEFSMPLGEGTSLTREDMLTRFSLAKCELLVEPDQTPIASPWASRPVASLLRGLKTARDQIVALQFENASLCTDLTMSQGK